MSTYIEPAVWFPAIRAGSGADVFTERLVEGLLQRGIRAEITWLPHRAEYAPWTVPVPLPPAWATIAHVNTWLPWVFLPRDIPVVATVHHCIHSPELYRFKSWAQAVYHRIWIKPVETKVLKRAEVVTAVSQYTAERTASVFKYSDINVIYNGIDIKGDFQTYANRNMHTPFRLLFVGNWSVRKGADLLYPIMKKLGADFELHYTADLPDPMTDQEENIKCIGRPKNLADLAAAYREADALLFPSRLEGFGLVVAEAMACGLPVIASNSSALPEVVEDGVTGILCMQDDVASFAAAAQRLAREKVLWEQMSLASRERVAERFSIEQMVDGYIQIYQRGARVCRI